MINWNNPDAQVSAHFTVHDTLYLPSWDVLHIPSAQEKANIAKFALIMDQVRNFLGLPINIHCWIRPVLNNPASPYNGQDYNVFVNGATHSAHRVGCAADWDCGVNCDEIRAKLLPMLEHFQIRAEDRPGSDWVHLDDFPVPPGGHRYFIA